MQISSVHCKIPVGKGFSKGGSMEPHFGTNGSKSTLVTFKWEKVPSCDSLTLLSVKESQLGVFSIGHSVLLP